MNFFFVFISRREEKEEKEKINKIKIPIVLCMMGARASERVRVSGLDLIYSRTRCLQVFFFLFVDFYFFAWLRLYPASYQHR
jgi:hypothetical protein